LLVNFVGPKRTSVLALEAPFYLVQSSDKSKTNDGPQFSNTSHFSKSNYLQENSSAIFLETFALT